jgi:hypothetical protein
MKFAPLALALAIAVSPFFAPVNAQGLGTDEQIIMKQVMSDKRSVYAQNLKLTDSESRAFWPIYDEYEAKAKSIDDKFLALVNDFAEKYDTLTEADAAAMLKTKMQLEKERMMLKQNYTRKIAKELPAVKALRYAQVETRLENMIRREVYGLIPLAR